MKTSVQVAERVLIFWTCDYFMNLMRENYTIVMPIMVPALLTVSETHWNKQITVFMKDALKIFNDMNPKLYAELVVGHQINVKKYVNQCSLDKPNSLPQPHSSWVEYLAIS